MQRLKGIYRRFRPAAKDGHREFTGHYHSWTEAQADSDGYQSKAVFEKVYRAARLVKDGHAVYERDSVVFEKAEHNWPLLSCLLHAIVKSNAPAFRVLDVGGALGTTYQTVRNFIPATVKLDWVIVEQPHVVQAGRKEFQTPELSFENDIDAAVRKGGIDLALLSGVLQYLRSPVATLTELSTYKIPYLLLDRTFFIEQAEERIVVQNVPATIYQASYACWLFNEQKFLADMAALGYSPFVDFESQYDRPSRSEEGKTIYYKGFYFQRRG